MPAGRVKILILLTVSIVYWLFVCTISGVHEPWDADAYWRIWYPVSFGLAAIAGFVFKARGWIAGLIVTFSQLPVLWFNNGTGQLWIVGLMLSFALAVPVVAVSALAGWFAARRRQGG